MHFEKKKAVMTQGSGIPKRSVGLRVFLVLSVQFEGKMANNAKKKDIWKSLLYERLASYQLFTN